MRSGESPRLAAARWFFGNCAGRQPEPGVAVERPEGQARRGGDTDQDEAVDGDRHAEGMDERAGQLRRDEGGTRAP